ncbi:Diadenosine hexaphosphate hydrolase [Microbacterium sp. 8M]|uniref:NUDIX hydrolase n=1 Tax=Microbacterium sp. 8M TaxID=2653153 RepID=UPI0012F39946|nr:NUDIX hydrolase [Microbacterium sp. 8M]VXB09991.1 Diadenosine hexaphosphate hydrolase [Microbacterium sp. 8M]
MSSAESDDLPVAGTAVVLRDAPGGIEALLLRRPDRGSFAGAWVFPGGMVEPGDRVDGAGEQEDAGRAAVRETAEEAGLELERLVPLSCWVPPAGIPKRVRTWFFLAADPGGALRPAPDEVVEARWFAPESALAARDAGEIVLMPPTWRTLHALRGAAGVEDALARTGDPAVFRTRMQATTTGTLFFWDGDELAGAAAGARERLVAEAPAWRFEGS